MFGKPDLRKRSDRRNYKKGIHSLTHKEVKNTGTQLGLVSPRRVL
ncbi:MAG: hypothetical protein AB4290_10555 [Spirulina sp.]